MKILAVIPARYESTRLPGKMLLDIQGKSLINRVFEAVSSCRVLDRVVVAVDHEKVRQHVESFGGEALVTGVDLSSGTDRCAQVLDMLPDYTHVINVQGDEPFIREREIDLLVEILNRFDSDIASLMCPIAADENVFNPNLVKVVTTIEGEALYFSRSAIPYVRGEEPSLWASRSCYMKHLGLYGFKAEILRSITRLPVSRYESLEKLEQLRWLENGYKIRMGETDYKGIGIDTEEDLQMAREILK